MRDKSIVSLYGFQGLIFGGLLRSYKGCKPFIAAKSYHCHNIGLIDHTVILDFLVCRVMPEMQGPFKWFIQ